VSELFPRATPRRHDEDTLQRSVVQYLRWSLPPDAEFYAVPNGGQRHAREAARLVGLGVRAGVPDLALLHAGRPLFIELKTPRGVVSSEQRQMHRKLDYCGGLVGVCRSLAEVEEWLRDAAAVPLRARLTVGGGTYAGYKD